MKDLFTPITRDERQEECKKAWIKSKGKGTIVACTGFGKSRIALMCMKAVLSKYPTLKILIVVPTDALLEQWNYNVDSVGLGFNCDVQVINSAIKSEQKYDMLVLDELHRYAADQFSLIFSRIKYKLILGLTATYERLDGRHVILDQFCPVVDTVPIEVAKVSGWVSEYTEYQVIISPDDIDKYKEYNKEFVSNFEYFNYDFNLVMKMLGKDGFKARSEYRNELCKKLNISASDARYKEIFKEVTYHATAFMRALQNRKKFIHNHPSKIDIAREIIEARIDKKIITFSANVKMAESIGGGKVYTGKDSKKHSKEVLQEFCTAPKAAVLHSCAKLNEGADVKGVSVAIILGVDSSETKAKQRTGRAIRKEGDKYSEIFTLVLEDTVECEWYRKSHTNINYVTIDVENLRKLLKGEPWEPYKKKVSKFVYRF